MKKQFISIISLLSILISCKGPEPSSAYVYNNNPHYAFGYADFYGAYYLTENGNKNNTISLSLFSDSLKIDDQEGLVGYGQYLFLEDIFLSPTDTLLPTGTYTINEQGTPFTVWPGINDTIDDEVYTVGATITYLEKNPEKSILKLISKGTIEVSKFDKNYTIVFQLMTADSLLLKGTYTGELAHYNLSLIDKTTYTRNKFPYKYALK